MHCPDCDSPLPIQVCMSQAGYYLGRFCPECGPYSRNSGYYPSRESAQKALECGQYVEA